MPLIILLNLIKTYNNKFNYKYCCIQHAIYVYNKLFITNHLDGQII